MDTVSTGKLIEEVARRTGLAKKAVQRVVEALSESVVEALARGDRVELRGLASFSVSESPPRLGRNPRTGKAVMIPLKRRVKAKVARAVRARVAEGGLSGGFGLYIAAKDDPWLEGVRSGLASCGYQLFSGQTIEEALRNSKRDPSELSFIMVGPSIDDVGYASIARQVKLEPETAMLPLVRGKTDLAGLDRPPTVQVIPDAAFDSVEKAVEVVRSEGERWREEKHYFGRQVVLRSPSDEASVEELKKLLESFYKDALADETEAYKTLSAFREAIDNAAIHGNKHDRSKYLTVTLMEDAERLALEVKDEGQGFDYEVFLGENADGDAASLTRGRLARGEPGGLGLRLMSECVDELRYSDGGSRVTLVKRRGA